MGYRRTPKTTRHTGKLTQRLTEIYDVSLKEAQADIKKLLWHLEEQGIVIIEE